MRLPRKKRVWKKRRRLTAPASRMSYAQSKLMQPGSSDINMERVEALKTAIRNGELKMDTQQNR
jgi:negative regulator of flagellin synthesis FlgM